MSGNVELEEEDGHTTEIRDAPQDMLHCELLLNAVHNVRPELKLHVLL